MGIVLIACAVVVVSGCAALSPAETAFHRALDCAHAVECHVKSLERTQHRTRLECFDRRPAGASRSRQGNRYQADL